MCGGIATMGPSKKSEDDYRAEDDHRTLTRAEEIRADKERMRGVQRHQKKSLRALKRVGRALGSRSSR